MNSTSHLMFLVLVLTVLLLPSPGHAADDSRFDKRGGQYYAIIANGDIDDFGWNALVNQGRVKMEAQLNMSGTLFVPNVFTEDEAYSVGKKLVQDGYRVIIYSNIVWGNAPTRIATEYPNVTFAQYGIKSPLPNLSDLVFSSLDYFFVIGVFAGMTTTNNKIGFIYPGEEVSSINLVNSFYSGVKYANPINEIHMVVIGTYQDEDREQGAADILINQIGVGSLIGQTNDLTVQKAAMAANMLAIGVTGYSLRPIFGEMIGLSLTHDWTSMFVALAPGVNGTVIKKDITGSFKTGAQGTDTPSHYVTDEQWNKTATAIAAMKSGNLLYQCGEYMAVFGALNEKGCLVNGTPPLGVFITPDIKNYGFYTVPLSEVKLGTSAMIGIVVAAAVCIAIAVVMMIVVYALRQRESIRTGSYLFLITFLAGTCLVYAGVIAWPMAPSVNTCYARVWLPSIGGTLAIAALVAKNLRIMLAFRYASQAKRPRGALELKRFIAIVFTMIAVDLILLGIYTAVGPEGVRVQQGEQGLSRYEIRNVCANNHSGDSVIYAILVYHGIQLLIGCAISYMCRIISDPKYDERKEVAFVIYGIAFVLVVFTVLVGIIGLTNDQLIIGIALALLLVTTFSVAGIFGSRLIDLFGGSPANLFGIRTISTSSVGTNGSFERSAPSTNATTTVSSTAGKTTSSSSSSA